MSLKVEQYQNLFEYSANTNLHDRGTKVIVLDFMYDMLLTERKTSEKLAACDNTDSQDFMRNIIVAEPPKSVPMYL